MAHAKMAYRTVCLMPGSNMRRLRRNPSMLLRPSGCSICRWRMWGRRTGYRGCDNSQDLKSKRLPVLRYPPISNSAFLNPAQTRQPIYVHHYTIQHIPNVPTQTIRRQETVPRHVPVQAVPHRRRHGRTAGHQPLHRNRHGIRLSNSVVARPQVPGRRGAAVGG